LIAASSSANVLLIQLFLRAPNEELTMTSTLSRKLKIYLRLLALVSPLGVQWQILPSANAQTQARRQHFVCNIGYTQQQCDIDMAVLRKALAKYPVDELGEWTWVLVGSEDWKRILFDRGFRPDRSPAFSVLPERETFFETALVTRVSFRGFQLSRLWHMPIEDLLDLAIRHELAHALCNDPNEAKADRAAIGLKNGAALSCQTKLIRQGD
jgi:hypothetical protein